MTIDEAIARERQQAKEQRNHIGTWDDEYSKKCEVYAEEHEQIAEWLEELKDYRDKNKMVVRIDCINSEEFNDLAVKLAKEQYNKAIDDFTEKAIKIVYESNNRDRNPQPRDMVADIHYKLLEISEQLKAGVKNES